jgi:iron transport multicopper oxidase
MNSNVTGWLVYDDAAPKPAAQDVSEFVPFDDFDLVPFDKEALFDHVDQSVTLNMKMGNLADGAN